MDFSLLSAALADLFTPSALIGLLVGTLVGSLTGVLPGLGAVGAMAVLMPFSVSLDATGAIVMLTGVYIGAQYGGSTTAILLRLPGESSSVITSIDGFEMTKRGRGGAALAISAIGSFVAGTLSVAALMFAAPALSDVAIRFSAPEFLTLAVLALFALSRVAAGSLALSLAAALLGVALSTVGVDPISGLPRFTFGIQELSRGLETATIAVGLFGLAEILGSVRSKRHQFDVANVRMRDLIPSREEVRRSGAPILRGSGIGFLFGLMPGPAAVLSTYASYGVERRVSKRKDEFGRGAVEGVAGPESANNAASGGAMVPLLALGIPFAAPTAILLGALTLQDVAPGPLLITQQPVLFLSIILGLYAANIVLLLLNLPLVRIFTLLLRVPQDFLLAGIVLVTLVGTYAVRNSIFDVYVVIAMGLLGHVMIRARIPRAPMILGFVLGAVIETSFSQTMALSGGDAFYLLHRPIALVFAVATVLVLVAPMLLGFVRRWRAPDIPERRREEAHETE